VPPLRNATKKLNPAGTPLKTRIERRRRRN
jgi:hypothetical protein